MIDLITFLEEQVRIDVTSLELSEKERFELIGQHKMLEWIKYIEEKGFPNDDRNTK